MHKKARAWLLYLNALEGVAASVTIFLIPSEGGTLSAARLVLIAIPMIISLLWIYMGIRHAGSVDRLAHPGPILGFVFIALASGLALFLLRYFDPSRFLSTYERLSPLLWYVLAMSAQMVIYLLYIYRGIQLSRLAEKKPLYRVALAAFAGFFFLFFFISITRLGLTFDPVYWGEPGVPILGWQFGLALTGGAGILCIGMMAPSRLLDRLLPVGIYLLMVVICLSVPITVLKNSFYMPMSRPDMVPYPYSDSAYYDQMAQSLLIGHPYQGVIPTRPLYILFLTLLHQLFGQDYARILIGQTLILALIPVLLYYLGKIIHSHAAGVTVALFFIFREWTSLLISSDTRVTNTKMLLVDLPTLLLLLLACLFVLRWFRRKGTMDGLIAGGVFGILLLLRTQSMLIVPFIFLLAFLVFGWRDRRLYRAIALFLVGLALSILPWLIHNQQVTGEFAFDAAFQNRLVIDLYAFDGNAAIKNMNTDGMGLGRILIEFALRDPSHVFGLIANHFLATQVNGLLALPIIEPYHGLHAPINLYWMNFDGRLAWYNSLLLGVYLAVIALGVGESWRRWEWIGLLPLVFSVAYALSTAVGRFSSWRYDFPADWMPYFYFGIGFAELIHQAAIVFGARMEQAPVEPSMTTAPAASQTNLVAKGVLLGVTFAVIGALPWMARSIAAPRYLDQTAETLKPQLISLSGGPVSSELERSASQPGTVLKTGRLLYPRYFNAGSGLSSSNPSPAYSLRDYSRLGFVLLNHELSYMVFPTKGLPGPAPHGSDVIILGCQRENYVEVRLLGFPALNALYKSEASVGSCFD